MPKTATPSAAQAYLARTKGKKRATTLPDGTYQCVVDSVTVAPNQFDESNIQLRVTYRAIAGQMKGRVISKWHTLHTEEEMDAILKQEDETAITRTEWLINDLEVAGFQVDNLYEIKGNPEIATPIIGSRAELSIFSKPNLASPDKPYRNIRVSSPIAG